MRRLADYWDDGEAADGEVVHCPLYMKDSRGVDLSDHMPGYRGVPQPSYVVDRALVDAKRRAWIDRTTNAWRMDDARRRKPEPPPDDHDDDDDDDELEMADARVKAAVARRLWIRKMADAWKSPGRDAGRPDPGFASSRPWQGGEPDASEQLLRRHLSTEPDPTAQARRDRAYASYCNNLENAWKTNPSAASAIERQGEKWRGGR